MQEMLLERAEGEVEETASAAASGLQGAVQRMPWKQLAAVLFLWVVFLLSQQQKSRSGHCTLGYLGWIVFQVCPRLHALSDLLLLDVLCSRGGCCKKGCCLQVIFLSAFTALAMRFEVDRVRTDPDHADPELREILSHAGGSTGVPAAHRCTRGRTPQSLNRLVLCRRQEVHGGRAERGGGRHGRLWRLCRPARHWR